MTLGRSRRLLVAGSLAVIALTMAACEDDPLTTDGDETGTSGIDREAVLGEVDAVRGLFEERSALDPGLISEVSYDDGELSVTLDEEASAGEGAEQAEQVCDDLAEAVQLPDLSIVVVGPGGEPLASCQFGS